mgnify:CR=1 FL=1
MSKSENKKIKIVLPKEDRYISTEERAWMMSKDSVLNLDLPQPKSPITIRVGDRVLNTWDEDFFSVLNGTWKEAEVDDTPVKTEIPEATEIPNLKPSNFDDWEITIDMDKRKFNFYNTRSKAYLNIKFDQLGFKVSRKGENVKIMTLLAYMFLKEREHQGAGYIVHHARMEQEITSIAVYRRTLQRVFRKYLTIRSSSKLFEKIYHNEETIVYKCNAELKPAENKNVYSNDIEYDDDIDYSKAPKRTRESTSSDY